jgi:hypothetical protein
MKPSALTAIASAAALSLSLAVSLPASASSSDPDSAAAVGQGASCSSSHWVATWTASPSDDFASVPLVDETIRQQIFTHYAGDTLRLHLTNRFSTAPVTFGAVTIGVQSKGASIRPGTLRTVRFAGKPVTTIPARGSQLSDPIHLQVSALQTLDVSLYVELAARPTEHFISQSTSWSTVAETGDHTQDLTGAAFPIATPVPGVTFPDLPQGIDYTDALDVRAPRSVGTVVAFGDSITDGFQGSLTAVTPTSQQLDQNSRWPDDLARRLHAAHQAMSVANAGISGNTIVYPPSIPILGPTGVTRFRRDALDVAGVTEIIVLLGINDVGKRPGPTDDRRVQEPHPDGAPRGQADLPGDPHAGRRRAERQPCRRSGAKGDQSLDPPPAPLRCRHRLLARGRGSLRPQSDRPAVRRGRPSALLRRRLPGDGSRRAPQAADTAPLRQVAGYSSQRVGHASGRSSASVPPSISSTVPTQNALCSRKSAA